MLVNYMKTKVASALRRPGDNLVGWFILNYMRRKNYYLEKGAVKLSCIESDHHVLEVGFGPGLGLEAAYKCVKDGSGKVYGVEYSPYAVKKARKHFKDQITLGKMEICNANVINLPYMDREFDRIFHCNCYYFWPDIPLGVKELHRVIKPGGIMITTLNLDSIQQAKANGYLLNANTDPLNYMVTLENVGFRNVAIEYVQYRSNRYQAIYAEGAKQ